MRNKILKPYTPALKGDKRYYLIAGGRAGGRSYFASQYAYTALITKSYFRCAIMRLVQGDIRNSIYQEIVDRLEENEIADKIKLTEQPPRLVYRNNKINGIGFRKSSGDQKAKLKSLAGYTDVIIEEAEEINEEDFNQLDDSLRTVKADIRIILLFNLPPKNHWIVKRWFNLIESDAEGFYTPMLKESEEHNTCYVHTTYKNNVHNLNSTTVDNFKRYKQTNPDHYYNMIMGLVPSGSRGLIYKNWNPITLKAFEELDYPVFYGTDFGFTNDPAGVVEVKIHNDNIYVNELIYKTGLINKKLSDEMELMGMDKGKENYCDSAEPKSVTELQTYGWNAVGADKGTGSRKAGVDYLLGKNVYYTENSENLIREMQGYCWALDKNKEPTNEPSDGEDHLLDAFRYAVYTRSKKPYIGF